jgi:tripartite-type tricarboxylate transporter receptor subunit TctC
MKPHRRQFLLAAGAATLPVVSRVAMAQTYPTRPVRIIVGFAPGSGTDIMARLIAPWLSERIGQQVVVENRPGAGSNIATEAVINSSPDGYTLLLVAVPNAVDVTLYESLKFDFVRDLVPVGGLGREPYVVVVNPLVPIRAIPELIAYAKANPGKINMASGGSGSGNHISANCSR